MRLSRLVSSLSLAVVVAGGVLASGGTADGRRVPKLGGYPATIDVAGFVTIRAFKDDTDTCTQGRDVAVEYRADLELGKPQKVNLGILGTRAFSSQARKPGGAVHEGEVVNYTETNECPPKSPVTPGKPECTKHRGTLGASLAPTPAPDLDGENDLAPLVRGVSIGLLRRGGGSQDGECLDIMGPVNPSVGLHVISTMEGDNGGIVVPLGVTDASFRKLRKGKAIRRLIRLNGACERVQISTGPAEGDVAARRIAIPRADCTVTGKIFVSVRRVG